jgi:hypothetical protein
MDLQKFWSLFVQKSPLLSTGLEYLMFLNSKHSVLVYNCIITVCNLYDEQAFCIVFHLPCDEEAVSGPHAGVGGRMGWRRLTLKELIDVDRSVCLDRK